MTPTTTVTPQELEKIRSYLHETRFGACVTVSDEAVRNHLRDRAWREAAHERLLASVQVEVLERQRDNAAARVRALDSRVAHPSALRTIVDLLQAQVDVSLHELGDPHCAMTLDGLTVSASYLGHTVGEAVTVADILGEEDTDVAGRVVIAAIARVDVLAAGLAAEVPLDEALTVHEMPVSLR